MQRGKLAWWWVLVAIPIFIAYAARASGDEPDDDTLYRYSTAAGAAILYAIMLLFILAIAGFRRDMLALRRPAALRRAIGLSAAVFVGVFIAIAVLERFLHGGEEQGLTPYGWQSDKAGAFIACFVVIAVQRP